MANTILVTGATGFAGRYVVPALQEKGFRVRGQYSRKEGTAEGVDWRQLNFIDSVDFGPLVEGCDAVLHLAAELSDVSIMKRVNVEATRALLIAAQSAGVRYFGYASSIVVYGSPRQRSVDEATPLIDPRADLRKQYYAEPYMLEYARTKVLAERVISDLQPTINVDFYRPAVVADLERLLEARDWSMLRKVGASYRRTQYIYAADAASAVAHLIARGLKEERGTVPIEAFNISDENCGTYRDLLDAAYKTTGDPRFKVPLDVPVLFDLAKDLVKYRQGRLRYPLGMLKISNAKLRSSGFEMPVGVKKAMRQALAETSNSVPDKAA